MPILLVEKRLPKLSTPIGHCNNETVCIYCRNPLYSYDDVGMHIHVVIECVCHSETRIGGTYRPGSRLDDVSHPHVTSHPHVRSYMAGGPGIGDMVPERRSGYAAPGWLETLESLSLSNTASPIVHNPRKTDPLTCKPPEKGDSVLVYFRAWGTSVEFNE